jgi:hypothetical protein
MMCECQSNVSRQRELQRIPSAPGRIGILNGAVLRFSTRTVSLATSNLATLHCTCAALERIISIRGRMYRSSQLKKTKN